MRLTRILPPLYSILLLTGCASSELAVRDMTLAPEQVNVGETSLISVEFSGPKNRVASVVAVVREVEGYFFDLVDDGTNGDVKANDNIWSVGIPVPLEAAPGAYSLDLTARDVDGNAIPKEGMEVSTDGYIGTLVVTVR